MQTSADMTLPRLQKRMPTKPRRVFLDCATVLFGTKTPSEALLRGHWRNTPVRKRDVTRQQWEARTGCSWEMRGEDSAGSVTMVPMLWWGNEYDTLLALKQLYWLCTGLIIRPSSTRIIIIKIEVVQVSCWQSTWIRRVSIALRQHYPRSYEWWGTGNSIWVQIVDDPHPRLSVVSVSRSWCRVP